MSRLLVFIYGVVSYFIGVIGLVSIIAVLMVICLISQLKAYRPWSGMFC